MASLAAQLVKNLPAMQEIPVWFLGWEGPLEEGMASRSSILAWRIHWQRSVVGYGPWGYKESDMTERLNTARLSFFPPYFTPFQSTWNVSGEQLIFHFQALSHSLKSHSLHVQKGNSLWAILSGWISITSEARVLVTVLSKCNNATLPHLCSKFRLCKCQICHLLLS